MMNKVRFAMSDEIRHLKVGGGDGDEGSDLERIKSLHMFKPAFFLQELVNDAVVVRNRRGLSLRVPRFHLKVIRCPQIIR